MTDDISLKTDRAPVSRAWRKEEEEKGVTLGIGEKLWHHTTKTSWCVRNNLIGALVALQRTRAFVVVCENGLSCFALVRSVLHLARRSYYQRNVLSLIGEG